MSVRTLVPGPCTIADAKRNAADERKPARLREM
jgi:hypothetical protein